MKILRSVVMLASIVTYLGCGDGDGSDAATNAPPVWTDAPTAVLSVGQGRTLVVPLTVEDPEGYPVTVSVTTATTLEAIADGDGGTLTLHPGYAASGMFLVTVTSTDDRGGTASDEVMVEVLPMAWTDYVDWAAPPGPEAREHPVLLVDEARDWLILLSGSGFNPQFVPLNDAWEMDVTSGSWAPLMMTGDALPAASSRRAAVVPGTGIAYLYGGTDASAASLGELYRVDFNASTVSVANVPQTAPPPARSLHAFAYDPVSDRFVAFGGVGGGAVLGDTWVMTLLGDVPTWTEVIGPGPSPRYGFFWGFDVDAGRLIVFSGGQGLMSVVPASDSWALDVRTDPPVWTLIEDGSAAPPGRRNGCFMFDPTGPRLFVFGGTADAMTAEPGLFALDVRPGQEVWSSLTLASDPPIRSSGAGFFDPTRGEVGCAFGNSEFGIYTDVARLGY